MTYRSTGRFAFEALEGIAVTLAVVLTWPVSKRWLSNWGSTAAEREQLRPGDAFVSPAHGTFTRAIRINAAAEAVWPWLVQFGLGRAGFYSYELLERLVGIPVRNVESIVPEFQHLAAGDEILLHPTAPGVPVAAVEEGRSICFGLVDAAARSVESPDPARSWSLYLDAGDATSSRLVVRSCIEPLRQRTLAKRVGHRIEAPIDFIMEQRMLRTIRRLAESGEPSP